MRIPMNMVGMALAGLGLMATYAIAQNAENIAPVPGPYQVRPQPPEMAAPVVPNQRYTPPMPYWMRPPDSATSSTQPGASGRNDQTGRIPPSPTFIPGWVWSQNNPQARGGASTQGGIQGSGGFSQNGQFGGTGWGPNTGPVPNYGWGYAGPQYYGATNPPIGYSNGPWGTPGYGPNPGGTTGNWINGYTNPPPGYPNQGWPQR